MKIGAKLILGFFTVTLLVWAVGVVGYVKSQQISKTFDTNIGVTAPGLFALTNIQNGAALMQKAGYRLALRQPESSAAESKSIEYANEMMDYWIGEYSKFAAAPEDRRFLAEIEESKKGLYDAAIEVANAKSRNDNGVSSLSNNLEQKSKAFDQIASEAIKFKQGEFKEQHKSAEGIGRESAIAIINLSLFAVVLAISLGMFISLSITEPLKRLKDNIEDISIGSVDFEIKGKKRKDEIGDVARSLDKIASSLKMMIKKEVGSKLAKHVTAKRKRTLKS